MMHDRINVLHLNTAGAVEIGTTFIQNEIVQINVNVNDNHSRSNHQLKEIT